MRGIGGGHKQRYRMVDFQRLRYQEGSEKVVSVRYDPCRRAPGTGQAPGAGGWCGGGPCSVTNPALTLRASGQVG